ncbi:MAG: Maf family protein [Bacteroidetes bacterium]|nr:Maf family protein [Bacteroidota bacterium]
MIKTNLPIILASNSPRRKKLLHQLNLNFSVLNVEIDERVKKNEKPVHLVKRLSLEKLKKAKEKIIEGIIITADTIVVLDGKVINKPVDKEDAKRILKRLSGRRHTVYTGYSIYNSSTNKTITDYEKTFVIFRKLKIKEIEDYILSGSPMDKAGAYGIQDDFGAVFIKKINGCYYNVVGLPLMKLYQTLLGII